MVPLSVQLFSGTNWLHAPSVHQPLPHLSHKLSSKCLLKNLMFRDCPHPPPFCAHPTEPSPSSPSFSPCSLPFGLLSLLQTEWLWLHMTWHSYPASSPVPFLLPSSRDNQSPSLSPLITIRHSSEQHTEVVITTDFFCSQDTREAKSLKSFY